MSKHAHLQSMEEQIDNKGHASAPFHYWEKSHQANKSMESGHIQMKAVVNNNSIQIRAYQIHEEKGGSDMDNWLEAEQILGNLTNSLVTSKREGSGGGG